MCSQMIEDVHCGNDEREVHQSIRIERSSDSGMGLIGRMQFTRCVFPTNCAIWLTHSGPVVPAKMLRRDQVAAVISVAFGVVYPILRRRLMRRSATGPVRHISPGTGQHRPGATFLRRILATLPRQRSQLLECTHHRAQ